MPDVTVNITIKEADVAAVRNSYGPGTALECLARLKADLARYLADKVEDYYKRQEMDKAAALVKRPDIS